MKPALLTKGAWTRLTSLARNSRGTCAVPYFGTGGSKLLPLKEGSLLVVRFDVASMRAGQTNPKDIVDLIKNGVSVFSCANLHAKVFVFGKISIIGSTNVSHFSANKLIEACTEIRSTNFSKKCEAFVKSLRGDAVGLDYAREMQKHYIPPKLTPLGRRLKKLAPRHSTLWLVSLIIKTWSDRDYEHEEAGLAKAKDALQSPHAFRIETFQWSGGKLCDNLKVGERVLMSTRMEDGHVLVSPPGRVLHIRRYRVNGKRRAIVYLELVAAKRRRNLKTFLRALGPLAKGLGDTRRTKQLHNPALVTKIGKMFV